jgi:membrane protease YdiL (CAAX protease family)
VGAAGRWIGPAAAIVVTGVLFGLAHAESLQLLGLATFGVILSAISYRTGRLGMNMAAHSAFNLVAVIAIVAGGSSGTILH